MIFIFIYDIYIFMIVEQRVCSSLAVRDKFADMRIYFVID